MKNVQVIDGAMNTAYAVYQFTDEEFQHVFPNPGQDIEFIEDVFALLGDSAGDLFAGAWDRRLTKPEVAGIQRNAVLPVGFQEEI